ncbi:DUF3854 domain-containing protein, partial [Microcoleus sp. OTE_8_concoct_300]|uniref:DUF3854 domain-containing protein n=1 Tax=Microcoleus sp. OTE_8_concoct_300 TaxID=2964710 RepID=UPI00403F71DD
MTSTSNLHYTSQLSQIYNPVELAYQDCVIKSGIDPEIFRLNFECARDRAVYDLLYRDTDPTTNSSSGSTQAKRNYTKCEDAIGWIANGRFRQLAGSPLAFDKKGRPRTYFQPQGKPLEIFCPFVTVAIWRAVAAKAGLSMPEFPAVGLRGEALGFWDWVISSGCPIVITEGEKKAAALISREYAAIGLPGIHTGYRVTEWGDWVIKPDGTQYQKAKARELQAILQRFDTAERQITILFDYRVGDYSNSPEF